MTIINICGGISSSQKCKRFMDIILIECVGKDQGNSYNGSDNSPNLEQGQSAIQAHIFFSPNWWHPIWLLQFSDPRLCKPCQQLVFWYPSWISGFWKEIHENLSHFYDLIAGIWQKNTFRLLHSLYLKGFVSFLVFKVLICTFMSAHI